MESVASERCVTCVADVGADAFDELAARYDFYIEHVVASESIPGSFWGEPEAGLVGRTVYIRADTPVHSVLHELSHLVCMSAERRGTLHRNAGGDDLEEAAVCFLQVLLADFVCGSSAATICDEMDAWGYSFRLGSTARWFAADADDAKQWLLDAGLITPGGEPIFRMRGD